MQILKTGNWIGKLSVFTAFSVLFSSCVKLEEKDKIAEEIAEMLSVLYPGFAEEITGRKLKDPKSEEEKNENDDLPTLEEVHVNIDTDVEMEGLDDNDISENMDDID